MVLRSAAPLWSPWPPHFDHHAALHMARTRSLVNQFRKLSTLLLLVFDVGDDEQPLNGTPIDVPAEHLLLVCIELRESPILMSSLCAPVVACGE